MTPPGINIFAAILSGIYSLVIFVFITKFVHIKQKLSFFGFFNILFNKWVGIAFLLYTFGFIKHEIGYYLTIESNYCEKTDVCEKLAKQIQTTWIDRFKVTFGFLENIWIENVGEGILFVLVGLPLFVLMKNKLVAAFLTGILADIAAEYTGIHKYFCKKSCDLNPLT
jgi:hypothetical protein